MAAKPITGRGKSVPFYLIPDFIAVTWVQIGE
jgi:hypothetical protein